MGGQISNCIFVARRVQIKKNPFTRKKPLPTMVSVKSNGIFKLPGVKSGHIRLREGQVLWQSIVWHDSSCTILHIIILVTLVSLSQYLTVHGINKNIWCHESHQPKDANHQIIHKALKCFKYYRHSAWWLQLAILIFLGGLCGYVWVNLHITTPKAGISSWFLLKPFCLLGSSCLRT